MNGVVIGDVQLKLAYAGCTMQSMCSMIVFFAV